MQFSIVSVFSLLIIAASAAPSASASSAATAGVAGTVSWDSTYDNGSQSTLTLACSDGINGLYTKGYKTLSQIPNFPNVGASPTIPGWNSPNCGKCYKIHYSLAGKDIYVTGVDASRSSGFVLSKAAMNTLTNGKAEMLGRVNVSWAEADPKNCGFKSTSTSS